MNSKRKSIGTSQLGLIMFLILSSILYLALRKSETHAQNQVPPHIRVSAIDDWSHHHMVYSRPSSVEQSLKLQSEPRYQQQLRTKKATSQQTAQ